MTNPAAHNGYPATPPPEAEVAPADYFETMIQQPGYLPSYQEAEAGIRQLQAAGMRDWQLDQKYGYTTFEYWNRDYMDALGTYLADRVDELGGSEENPVRILEVGAGNGRLSHFLREQMEARAPGRVTVTASDSGRLEIDPDFPVENADCETAIRALKPNIVIWSWMPYGQDYTDIMRAEPSVDEYILIGEEGYGAMCGDSWLTWGQDLDHDGEIPPYEREGFEKSYLPESNSLQTSRTRFVNMNGGETSSTVSFRRVQPAS